jgi:serine protease Do
MPPEVWALNMAGGSYIGVGTAEVDSDRAKELKLPETRGVEITRVEDGSPASKAGIKEHDVVLEYNGRRVEGTAELQRLVRETPAGRQVKMVVWRGGASQTLSVTVGERKARAFAFGGVSEDWQKNMKKLQDELGRMQWNVRMREMPEPFMAWRTPALGIEAESLTSQLADFFGVKEGVLVRSVIKDTPAEKGGLKAGDVITRVDGERVTSPGQISSRIRSLESKKTFPVTVTRNRSEMTLNVTLEDRPEPRKALVGPQRIKVPRFDFQKPIRGRTISITPDQM